MQKGAKKVNELKSDSGKNLHAGHRIRMFEKLKAGRKSLKDHELIEMLLFFTNAQKDTNKIAHELLRQFGGFKGVLAASEEELQTVSGVGERSAGFFTLLHEVYVRAGREEFARQKLDMRSKLEAYTKSLFEFETSERFFAVALDSKFNLICPIDATEDSSAAYAKINVDNVMKKLVSVKAKEVVLCHNHLQNGTAPTQDDVDTTKVLMQKMLGVGIVLRDHFIVNQRQVFSFAAQGWIRLWADNMLSPSQYKAVYASEASVASGGIEAAEILGLKII